jgi:hypothetical protein
MADAMQTYTASLIAVGMNGGQGFVVSLPNGH